MLSIHRSRKDSHAPRRSRRKPKLRGGLAFYAVKMCFEDADGANIAYDFRRISAISQNAAVTKAFHQIRKRTGYGMHESFGFDKAIIEVKRVREIG